jgi:hypothetical protein
LPDFPKMRGSIDRAENEIKNAIEAIYPLDKLTQLESYVLGYLRAVEVVLKQAKEVIEQTRILKKKQEAEQDE